MTRTKSATNPIEYEESSGNVFADIGLPNPEEHLAKAELAFQICQIIRERKLTQVKAAKLLGIKQPNVSALMKGHLGGFSAHADVRVVVDAA